MRILIDPPLGLGNLDLAEHFDRAIAGFRLPTLWCSRIASLICGPMVNTGLSEVIGS